MANDYEVQVLLFLFRCLNELIVVFVLNRRIRRIKRLFIDKLHANFWLISLCNLLLSFLLELIRPARLDLFFLDRGCLRLCNLLLYYYLLTDGGVCFLKLL